MRSMQQAPAPVWVGRKSNRCIASRTCDCGIGTKHGWLQCGRIIRLTTSLFLLQRSILMAIAIPWPNHKRLLTVVRNLPLTWMKRFCCTALRGTAQTPLFEKGLTIEPVTVACTVLVLTLPVQHAKATSTPARNTSGAASVNARGPWWLLALRWVMLTWQRRPGRMTDGLLSEVVQQGLMIAPL